jgi:transposase
MTEKEYGQQLSKIVMLFSGDVVDIVRSRMKTIVKEEHQDNCECNCDL